MFRRIEAEITRCLSNFDVSTFRRLHECPCVDVVSEEIFDEAVQCIYQLLEDDSFDRFKRGPCKLSVIVPTPAPAADIMGFEAYGERFEGSNSNEEDSLRECTM